MPELHTIYTEQFPVYRHDGDCYGRAKAGAMLRYAQQIATEHAEAAGLTTALYQATHTAHVLAKLALHIEHTPHVDETLTLTTYPEQVKHAVNKRYTVFSNAAGAQVAALDSRWVVIDTEKRSILRKHPAEFPNNWAQDVPYQLPLKLQKAKPEACSPVGECTADYTLCDTNGHLNNTCYADVICNALPWSVWQTSELRDLILYYHREIPMGERFTLRTAEVEPGLWYFAGDREGHCAFEANLRFEPRVEE